MSPKKPREVYCEDCGDRIVTSAVRYCTACIQKRRIQHEKMMANRPPKLCRDCKQQPAHNIFAIFCMPCLEKRQTGYHKNTLANTFNPAPDPTPERPPKTRMHLRWLRGQKFVHEANRIIKLDFEWQEYQNSRSI